jgi:hypothetical protein
MGQSQKVTPDGKGVVIGAQDGQLRHRSGAADTSGAAVNLYPTEAVQPDNGMQRTRYTAPLMPEPLGGPGVFEREEEGASA